MNKLVTVSSYDKKDLTYRVLCHSQSFSVTFIKFIEVSITGLKTISMFGLEVLIFFLNLYRKVGKAMGYAPII